MSTEKGTSPSAPRPSLVAKKAPASNPKTLDMVLEAVASVKSSRGVALPTIKKYIEETYPTAKTGMLNTLIKRSIERGLDEGLLIQPPSSEGTGMKARWKVDKQKVADLYKPKKKVTKVKKVDEDQLKSVTLKKRVAKSPSRKTKSPKSAGKKPAKKSLGDKKKATKSPKPATKKSPKAKPSKPKPRGTKSPKTSTSPKAKPKKAPSSSNKQKAKKTK